MVLVALTHVLPLGLASTMGREPADSVPTAKRLPHTGDWPPLSLTEVKLTDVFIAPRR